MKTLRNILGAAAIVLTGVLFGPARLVAQDDVAATKHNLSANDPTGGNLVDYGEICVYCHTPHGGQIDAPLWNRGFSTATYDMYDNAHSSTIDMTVDAQPTGISMACLSCHDGTIGLDVVINPPNTYGGPTPVTIVGTNTMPTGGFTFLDTDLRNDHPISVIYDPVADPAFNPIASVTGAGGLRLFGTAPNQKVQCASCHNPHNNSFAPFLRKSNAASDLCKTCHVK